MRILGIDPGVNRVGYGLVESAGGRETVVRTGVIVPPAKESYEKKVSVIIEAFDKLLEQFCPDVVVIEEIYLGKNFRIALKIGQVMGIILGSVARKKTAFHLISPREIKQDITGKGNADKRQVQFMLEHMTGYKNFKNEDESDAVAAAISYLNSKKEHDLLHSGKTGF
jgi:crossover junction endodeoxyribonuclease RuvC